MNELAETLPIGAGPALPPPCPFGHIVTRATAVTGWQPCTCPGASSERGITFHWPGSCETCASARIANTCGHYTWLCRACFTEHREMVYYDPPHVPALESEPAGTSGEWVLGGGPAPEAFSFYVGRKD